MSTGRFPFSRRQVLAGAGAFGIASTLGGFSGKAAGATNALRMRGVYDLRNLDPFNTGTDEDSEVVFALYPGLARYVPTYKPGEKFSWALHIASALEQVDATHIKFTLKPGFGWTNGFGPLTADDVKFTFERAAGDKTLGYHSDWASLDHVEVSDDHNGVIVLKEPNVSVMASILPMGRGSIMSRKAIESSGGQIGLNPPATCGAYTIKSVRPKQEVVFAANPDWAGDKPDFDEVVMLLIDNDKSAELAFQAGEIDFLRRLPRSSVSSYKTPPTGVTLDVRPLVGIEWVGLNVDSPPLDDIRVRQAIILAADVDAILQTVYFGTAQRATGMVPPGVLGYRDNLTPQTRDVARAKALLAEAGHGDGLQLKLAVLNDADQMTMAQLLQAAWAEVGITVQIDSFESGTYWSLGSAEGGMWKDTQLILQSWGYAAPDAVENLSWWTGDQVGLWNWQRWHSDEYDSLYKQATVELDEAKRRDMFVRLQDMLDASYAYLYITPGTWANLYRDTVRPATSFDGRKYQLQHFKRA